VFGPQHQSALKTKMLFQLLSQLFVASHVSFNNKVAASVSAQPKASHWMKRLGKRAVRKQWQATLALAPVPASVR
jgi:hypothetical protein